MTKHEKYISIHPAWIVLCWFHFVNVTVREKQDIKYPTETLQLRKHKCSKWCRKGHLCVFRTISWNYQSKSFPVYWFDPYRRSLQIDSLQLSLKSISIIFFIELQKTLKVMDGLLSSLRSNSSKRVGRFISPWCLGAYNPNKRLLWDQKSCSFMIMKQSPSSPIDKVNKCRMFVCFKKRGLKHP